DHVRRPLRTLICHAVVHLDRGRSDRTGDPTTQYQVLAEHARLPNETLDDEHVVHHIASSDAGRHPAHSSVLTESHALIHTRRTECVKTASGQQPSVEGAQPFVRVYEPWCGNPVRLHPGQRNAVDGHVTDVEGTIRMQLELESAASDDT